MNYVLYLEDLLEENVNLDMKWSECNTWTLFVKFNFDKYLPLRKTFSCGKVSLSIDEKKSGRNQYVITVKNAKGGYDNEYRTAIIRNYRI